MIRSIILIGYLILFFLFHKYIYIERERISRLINLLEPRRMSEKKGENGVKRKIIPSDGDTSWHNPHGIIPRDFEDVPARLLIFLSSKNYRSEEND